MKKFAILSSLVYFLISCSPVKNSQVGSSLKLKFLDEFDVPHNTIFRSTTVGGLSGIDYDIKNNLYYLICDDRSSINPARFYIARIGISNNKIDTVEFLGVHHLLQSNGLVFPNSKQNAYRTPDPEAIRYNPKTGLLVWSSEGERLIRNDTVVLADPAIYLMNAEGKMADSFEIPPSLHMQSVEKGPRQNGVFEGMTFINDFRELLVSVEEPLYEDGPRAGINDSSAVIRMLHYDIKSKKIKGQYGYVVDPVAYPSNPAEAYKINGIPDILSVNKYQLLVLERSFSSGRPGCTIKVYLANLAPAAEISKYPGLYHLPFHTIEKKLILNMDNLGIYIDNIEGMTWGPLLPNGHRTLLFVADNNFSSDEVTQFLLFEVEQTTF